MDTDLELILFDHRHIAESAVACMGENDRLMLNGHVNDLGHFEQTHRRRSPIATRNHHVAFSDAMYLDLRIPKNRLRMRQLTCLKLH